MVTLGVSGIAAMSVMYRQNVGRNNRPDHREGGGTTAAARAGTSLVLRARVLP